MPSRLRRTPVRTTLAALCCLVVTGVAGAGERHVLQPGDKLLGTVRTPNEFHEVTVDVPRGARLRFAVRPAKGSDVGACFSRKGNSCLGLFDERYRNVRLTFLGGTALGTNTPAGASGLLRIVLTGRNDRTGDFRVVTHVTPGKKFLVASRADVPAPRTTLVFGAYPGFTIDVKVAWKGEPVTIAAIHGPDGQELTTTEAPRARKTSFKQGGYVTTTSGDHVLTLDVPAGAKKWSARVKVKGRLPESTIVDDRAAPDEPPPALVLGMTSADRPVILVLGESGGANDVLMNARAEQPFVVGTLSPDCQFTTFGDPKVTAEFDLDCGDGTHAEIRDLQRDAAGLITEMTVDPIETPSGNGAVTFDGFLFEATWPVAWTEVRTFEGTGNTHRLVVENARAHTGGAFTFTVHHTDPSGQTRRYDFLPFQ